MGGPAAARPIWRLARIGTRQGDGLGYGWWESGSPSRSFGTGKSRFAGPEEAGFGSRYGGIRSCSFGSFVVFILGIRVERKATDSILECVPACRGTAERDGLDDSPSPELDSEVTLRHVYR